MTLVRCSECGEPVSDKASTCPHCGAPVVHHIPTIPRPAAKRSRPLAWILAISATALIVVAVLLKLGSARPTLVRSAGEVAPAPIEAASPINAAQSDSAHAAVRADALRRLAVLKRRFIFHPDSMYGGGWYEHRDQAADNSWNRSYLSVGVWDNGAIALESHYYGEDWISQKQIVVRIGDEILTSEEIPPYDPAVHHSNSGDAVWETIYFTNRRDNGIIDSIASHVVFPIRVRMTGDQGYHEFMLSARDKLAIRDSYELSRALEAAR